MKTNGISKVKPDTVLDSNINAKTLHGLAVESSLKHQEKEVKIKEREDRQFRSELSYVFNKCITEAKHESTSVQLKVKHLSVKDKVITELKSRGMKIKEALSKENNHDDRFLINNDNTMIIHMYESIKTIEDLAVFNHELLHAAIAVHRIVDINLDYNSEESYTYLYSYLCKQAYKQLNLKFE